MPQSIRHVCLPIDCVTCVHEQSGLQYTMTYAGQHHVNKSMRAHVHFMINTNEWEGMAMQM